MPFGLGTGQAQHILGGGEGGGDEEEVSRYEAPASASEKCCPSISAWGLPFPHLFPHLPLSPSLSPRGFSLTLWKVPLSFKKVFLGL